MSADGFTASLSSTRSRPLQVLQLARPTLRPRSSPTILWTRGNVCTNRRCVPARKGGLASALPKPQTQLSGAAVATSVAVAGKAERLAVHERARSPYLFLQDVMSVPLYALQLAAAPPRVTAARTSAFAPASGPTPRTLEHLIGEGHRVLLQLSARNHSRGTATDAARLGVSPSSSRALPAAAVSSSRKMRTALTP